jgi:LysM repeat protein
MPISHKSPYRRHVFGSLAVCLVGLTLAAAWQQGWMEGTAVPRSDTANDVRIAGVDVPPPYDEPLEIPSEIDIAQSEPEEPESEPVAAPALPRRRVRQSQWLTSGIEREDEIADFELENRKGRKKTAVVTAGFEEEAPPISDFSGSDQSDDDEPAGRQPSKSSKNAIARKSADSAKGAAPSQPIETDQQPRPAPQNGDEIQALIDDDKYIEAQKELSQWFWQKPDKREQIMPKLHKLSRALYFSPQPHFYEPYVVKPGDQLRVIGQRYKLSWEYIAKLNQVDAKKIRAGQKLKIVPGPFGAIVFLERFELVVHLNGSFVKSYPVGVGKDGTTPVGRFVVKDKMADPTYYGPDGVIAHDDPNNPLGERWIDIGDHYGIHGTIDPESIGKKESRGCIRMLNRDVEEVYDFLVIGSEVKIVRQ